MKMTVRSYEYAPELNRVIIHGTKKSFECKGLKTIKEIRQSLFKKPTEFKRGAVISVTYPNKELADRIISGTIKDYKALKQFIADLKKRHDLGIVKIHSVYSIFA